MTPKEKARDLINKYNFKVLDTHLGGSNARVIECALVAVDELIELSKYTDGYYEWDYFYGEVKQELLNLKYK